MSLSEAMSIKQKHGSIEHAVLEILNECNISITNASRNRYRRKLSAADHQRTEARRRGRLAMWLAGAEQEEFCPRIPPVQEEHHREDIVEDDPVVEDDDADYLPPAAPRPPGRQKAPLSPALDRSTVYKRVDNLLPSLQEIADAENTDLLPLLIIVLATLCGKYGWHNLANFLQTVFNSMTDIAIPHEIGLDKSAYLLVSQELGRERYADLRNTLTSEGIHMQPWYKVNAYFESITPTRIPVIINQNEGQIGYRFSFIEVCKSSVNRALLANNISKDQIPSNIYIGGKDGTDGSGQHFCHATVKVAVKGNILLYSFTPLII